VCAAAILAAACRQDMHDQPSHSAFEVSSFFQDGRSQRPPLAGTIARGQLSRDALFDTGRVDGEYAAVFPFAIDRAVMTRGRERFDIFCAPCHGRTGRGDGMIVRRGYRQPPSLHGDRLREAQPGYVFEIITAGFGAMPDYAVQIPVRDRWAIVAYVRALQLSQHVQVAALPPALRQALPDGDREANAP
jgi:mono/diheme cytochrome c family protein